MVAPPFAVGVQSVNTIMDKVLLACDHYNFEECLELANEYGLGLEVQTFAFPDALDNHPEWVEVYVERLKDFSGSISMHGAFMDMSCASFDSKIVAVTRDRYRYNLELGARLNAHTIVFHANYLTNIRNAPFRRAWTDRQVAFWSKMVQEAAGLGLRMAIENMWEYEPSLIGDVLRQVNSPWLITCLDVGHAHLFGEVPFKDWLADLGSFIQYTHLNNNGGRVDEHRGFDDGVLDYNAILPQLRALPVKPYFSLEIESAAAMRRSLPYLEVERKAVAVGG
jgi:sugar phosphate isomerase/epimerase